MLPLVNFSYNYVDYAHVSEFDMIFQPVTRSVGTWQQELAFTVKNIANQSSRRLALFLGGGIDSEVVAREMIQQGIDFVAITLKHTDQANFHDVHWADQFCQNYNIEQVHLDFDSQWFFSNKILQYRRQGYISRRAWRYFHIYLVELAEQLNFTGIICSGEQIYKTINNEICSSFSSEQVVVLEYCRQHQLTHYPFLHLQNSELLAAYMKTDIIQLLLSNPDYFRSTLFNTSLEKILVYHRYYTNMSRRNKADGFEKCVAYQEFNRKNRILYPNFVDHCVPVTTIQQQLNII